MPTAGRLAGAVAFAILGYYLSQISGPYFEEAKVPGYWMPLGIVAGIFAGWVVVGKRTGRGYPAGVGNGITGGFALVFWMLFVLAFMDMLQKSFRRSYDGPVEAVVDVFTIIAEHVVSFGVQDLIVAAVAGSIAAGLFAEFFGKRYS